MTKIGKLRLCNRLLFFMTLMIFVSSVQLEIIGSSNPFWIWGHIFVGCLFVGNVVWHLYLHYGWNSWIRRVYRQKKIMNKWLSVLIILTCMSAIIAVFHWMVTYIHSPIGGIHGKVGLIFLLLALGHVIKRIRFYYVK